MISLTKKSIAKLKRKLASMRAGSANLKHQQLVNFAKSIGRERIKAGDEPTYISTILPKSKPISIPGHKKIKRFTAESVLDRFEEDLFLLEEMIEGLYYEKEHKGNT